MQPAQIVKVLKPPEPQAPWRLIRDQRVREAEVRAAIEVKRLEEEERLLVGRKGQVESELERVGESEAGVRAHRTLARWWGAGFMFASAVMIATAWWTLNWYLSLTWEKGLLALTLFILPLIGWAAFLLFGKQKVDLSWRLMCGLGLAVVLLSVLATALLGAGRMAGVLLDEERQEVIANQPTGELTTPTSAATPNDRVARVKKLLAVSGMVAVILLAIACEIAAGLAFHEYYRRMTVVWTVWPFYREHSALSQAIADNLSRQEEVRRQPEILDAQLTASGLEAEAAQAEKAAAAARADAEAEAKANSLGRVVKIVLIVGGLAVLMLLAAAAVVLADERHAQVVILDLSASMASDEFARDVQAVEGLIERLGPETRIVVLGVTEASFNTPPLFVATSPKNGGRFGEYLNAWRGKVIRDWRVIVARLQPTAKGSDILGALARAATEFEELPQASKTLIVLSDMRHVGPGLNLERDLAPSDLSALDKRGLVAPLPGVQVWMLGVHTDGIDAGRWRGLKAFWCQYFRRAGARVQLFSPNRKVPLA